ncbi:MAG TPA: hypothetical protein PLD18_03400 [Flavobacterium sp.]|nr:hypothetical protein [Flavobacterium sp.]HRA71443.1 hypothetical protein [Flavobacterium sp.]
MKKLPLYLMMIVLSLSVAPTSMSAKEKDPIASTANPKEVPAEVKIMVNRLEEIKAMDKSSMTRVEKKELRKEVKEIKANLRSSNSGIYLSVGAIIIIVLLLILLL